MSTIQQNTTTTTTTTTNNDNKNMIYYNNTFHRINSIVTHIKSLQALILFSVRFIAKHSQPTAPVWSAACFFFTVAMPHFLFTL